MLYLIFNLPAKIFKSSDNLRGLSDFHTDFERVAESYHEASKKLVAAFQIMAQHETKAYEKIEEIFAVQYKTGDSVMLLLDSI